MNPAAGRGHWRQDASDILGRYCVYAKVYGERNSGTNFLEELLRTNFVVHCLQGNNPIHEYARELGKALRKAERGPFRSALVDLDCQRTMLSDFGWKHGVPPVEQIRTAPHTRHTLFLCIAKHPAAWLKSLMDRPYSPVEPVPKEFSAFIRHQWPLTVRDNVPGAERIDVVGLWNVKNSAYLALREVTPKCIVIAYEKLLDDPAGFLERVSSYLWPRRKRFVWSLASTKGDRLTFEEYREKYRLENVCQSINNDDLSFIIERSDKLAMREFDYQWP